MNRSQQTSAKKPYTILGAGRLVSTFWKAGDERSGWRYRFNVYRMNSDNGQVSQLFGPTDVKDLVKLSQVLATVLADDGCIPTNQRRALADLAAQLDTITRKRS